MLRAAKLMLRLPSTLSRSSKIGAAMPVMPFVTSPVVWSHPVLRMRFRLSWTAASASPRPAAENSPRLALVQRRDGSRRHVGQDDPRGGAAQQRHRAAALIGAFDFRGAALLMHAQHLAAIAAAEQRDAGDFPHQLEHHRPAGPDDRIVGADFVIELDDARPERVAGFGQRRQQFGVREDLEVAIERRAGVAEPAVDAIEGPARRALLEQVEHADHALQAVAGLGLAAAHRSRSPSHGSHRPV